jgi:Skp family chaperone for outer membrane proteins
VSKDAATIEAELRAEIARRQAELRAMLTALEALQGKRPDAADDLPARPRRG